MDYKELVKLLKLEGWEIQTGGRHVKAKKRPTKSAYSRAW